ncbi:MAG: hypothetical protein IPO95_13650 [Rhodanobacteraceae bacterium]|nr:hypothetical protein [Rhodanobacteraceae bacterium]
MAIAMHGQLISTGTQPGRECALDHAAGHDQAIIQRAPWTSSKPSKRRVSAWKRNPGWRHRPKLARVERPDAGIGRKPRHARAALVSRRQLARRRTHQRGGRGGRIANLELLELGPIFPVDRLRTQHVLDRREQAWRRRPAKQHFSGMIDVAWNCPQVRGGNAPCGAMQK